MWTNFSNFSPGGPLTVMPGGPRRPRSPFISSYLISSLPIWEDADNYDDGGDDGGAGMEKFRGMQLSKRSIACKGFFGPKKMSEG